MSPRYTETAVGNASSVKASSSRDPSLHSDCSPFNNGLSALTEIATPEPLQRDHLEAHPCLEQGLSDMRHTGAEVGGDSDAALTEIVAPPPVQRHVEQLALRPISLERSLSNASRHGSARKPKTRSCIIF
ncbi:uncharacterized protein KD926_006005 [Aspergillus affinis]|uniref:uncharacterized protein n=1 Tax=Aspergillus affinis TaxID=1070780 RepID=UPI0022FE107E|nr:uncharacterized protein KD926_006005 [Aspergillus affinis]KAI9046058.1 hypothetical protein KD926_006005 [Aspergillus affinis]